MNKKQPVSVIIADKNPSYAAALAEMLTESGFAIKGHVSTESELQQLIAENKADLLLFDFFITTHPIHKFAKSVDTVQPGIKLVCLSHEAKINLPRICFDAGVHGFCDKNFYDFSTLTNGLENVSKGNGFYYKHVYYNTTLAQENLAGFIN